MKTIEQWTDEELDAYIWQGIEPHDSVLAREYDYAVQRIRTGRQNAVYRITLCAVIIALLAAINIWYNDHQTQPIPASFLNNMIYDDQRGALRIEMGYSNPEEGDE